MYILVSHTLDSIIKCNFLVLDLHPKMPKQQTCTGNGCPTIHVPFPNKIICAHNSTQTSVLQFRSLFALNFSCNACILQWFQIGTHINYIKLNAIGLLMIICVWVCVCFVLFCIMRTKERKLNNCKMLNTSSFENFTARTHDSHAYSWRQKFSAQISMIVLFILWFDLQNKTCVCKLNCLKFANSCKSLMVTANMKTM